MGPGTADVNTPPRESHVLNDAILQAALDLRKRDRTRRKIIFVISDGREMGSKASYRDVLRVLLSNEIQVEAVSVGSAALPVYDKIERLHVPLQGYGDILPRYASATGGSEYRELTRSSIENMYAQVMSEARNQYTLGYSPTRPKVPTPKPYRSIEVIVDRPGLKVYARDGYYPAPAPPRPSADRTGGAVRDIVDCRLLIADSKAEKPWASQSTINNQPSTIPPVPHLCATGGHLSNLRRTDRV